MGATTAARSSLVTVVRDKNVMDAGFKVDSKILKTMLDQTVLQLTGKTNIQEAWAELVKPDDIVGLVPTPHLNPTHPELVDAVKASLMKEVGIPEKNIIMAQGGKRKPETCTALISHAGTQGTLVNRNRDRDKKLYHVFRPSLQISRMRKAPN